jgi:GNAT superfamily N-acetyltransferase
MESTLELDLLTPVDWRVLRAARLYALLDSPDAFTSSYAHELAWGELEWQRVLHAATWIVAREAQRVIGLAKSVSEPGRPSTRYVESAWVAPTHRRRGVLRALLQRLAEIDRQTGVTDLMCGCSRTITTRSMPTRRSASNQLEERQHLPAVGRFENRLWLGLHP